jgi:hypothetical protein
LLAVVLFADLVCGFVCCGFVLRFCFAVLFAVLFADLFAGLFCGFVCGIFAGLLALQRDSSAVHEFDARFLPVEVVLDPAVWLRVYAAA